MDVIELEVKLDCKWMPSNGQMVNFCENCGESLLHNRVFVGPIILHLTGTSENMQII
jgi:hypothetical protein